MAQKKQKRKKPTLKFEGDYKGKNLKEKSLEFGRTAKKQATRIAKDISTTIVRKQKMQMCAKKGGKWVKGKCVSK